jgi:hypothetical protein
MRNSQEIGKAIGKAATKAGSNTKLGHLTGIHNATIGKYRNGVIRDISDDHWQRLLPFIQDFLPPEIAESTGAYSFSCLEDTLTKDEQKLLRIYRAITPALRQSLLTQALECLYEAELGKAVNHG